MIYLRQKKISKKLFHNTEKNIKQMFEKVRFNISKIISSEIQNKSAKLREANKDIESAFEKVKNKIDQLLRELKFSIDTEITNLIIEINNRFKQKLQEKYINISSKNFNSDVGLGSNLSISFFTSTAVFIIGENILADLIGDILGATAGGVFVGPIGIGIGFGVGIIISGVHLLLYKFQKEKRYVNGLYDFKQKLDEELNSCENTCLEDIKLLETEFIDKFNIIISTFCKEIVKIEQNDWDDIKKKYTEQKLNIFKIITDI